MVHRGLQIVVALGLASLATACVRPPPSATACAYRALGHPTMTADAISIGLDNHVHAVSEGATGEVGNH